MTTTPTERVQRLRALLAEATPAPWSLDWRFIRPGAVALVNGQTSKVEANGALIVRLRNAAEAQLSQLEVAFAYHRPHLSIGGQDLICQVCRTYWDGDGCAQYRAALAVLDKLDGGDQ